jgi:hypothetical protein
MPLIPFRRERNFRLFVDSASERELADRWFASLEASLRAFERLDGHWKPHAWIIEYHDQQVVGGIPTVRNVVHMKQGKRTGDEAHAAERDGSQAED